jgi:prephenate dehydratase
MSKKLRISFQGAPGAFSDIAARQLYPEGTRIHCPSFKEAIMCLDKDWADIAVIPVTNTTAGPVTNALTLLRDGDYIVLQQLWTPIHHCLMAVPDATLKSIRTVHSHWQALAQCRINIKNLGLEEVEAGDTAGAAVQVSEWKDPSKAAIASSLAAEEFGLQILKENFEDKPDNKTLFLAVMKEKRKTGGTAINAALAELGL